VIDGIISFAISAGLLFATTDTSGTTCGLTPKAFAYNDVGIQVSGDCHYWTSSGAFWTYWALVFLVPIALFWVLPALTGASPGKAAVGLRIIRRNGKAPGFGRVFVRGLMWIVDAFPYIIPYLTGFLVALNDKNRHQRLGDRVAGTFVIDKSEFGSFVPDQQASFGQQPPQFGPGPQQGGYPPQQPQQQPAPVGGGPAPGWYDDPQREARLRYWDGSTWTSHTSA
jgi:uncharacterized RDD family membrane protein YckC